MNQMLDRSKIYVLVYDVGANILVVNFAYLSGAVSWNRLGPDGILLLLEIWTFVLLLLVLIGRTLRRLNIRLKNRIIFLLVTLTAGILSGIIFPLP